ncbi:C-C chemokine receptor type 6 [Pelobates fuscus]|uniref:C-C chemokine receptor type 6 n=1 Tax=Pelobates fuscus TaxID=191477 RepID=UPI002FE4C493
METSTPVDDYESYPTVYDIMEESKVCTMVDFGNLKKKLVPVVFSLIFAFGLLGNLLVIVTFNYYKRAKSMTDVYLLNMAIADILLVLTLPFWAVYYHEEHWIFKDFMCKLVRAIYAINFNCSMLLLACVGIDRYVAIVQVTKSFKFRTTAMAYKKLICLFVWVISACLSIITYYFNECYKINGDQWVCEQNYRNIKMPLNLKFTVIIVQVTIGFFIPFLVMLFCYTFIIKTLLQAQNSQRHKAIRVIVAVVAVFLICQSPYNMLLLKKATNLLNQETDCDDHRKTKYGLFVTEVLAFCHCCLNPVIYAFVGVKFRNYFVKIMQDLWCTGKRYIIGNRSSRMSSDAYTSRRTSEVYATEGGSSFTM